MLFVGSNASSQTASKLTYSPIKWAVPITMLVSKRHHRNPDFCKEKGVFMFPKNALETNSIGGVFQAQKSSFNKPKLSNLVPSFLKYARYELCLADQTIKKYADALKWVQRDLGDIEVESLTPGHFIELKGKIYERGAGSSRVSTIVFAMKSFLVFCREAMNLHVLDPKELRPPKREKREVIFLANDEVKQFVDSIKIYNRSYGRKDQIQLDGLRFRTLVEVLLGTGMRISEALSLNRESIDFEKREAKIIGKGNKERTVFFSDRSLEWIKFYLKERKDTAPALFTTRLHSRLTRADVSELFVRQTKKAGMNKGVSPRILRHTVATNLLFNGCPISHVKEILGHELLVTTCTYYLGMGSI